MNVFRRSIAAVLALSVATSASAFSGSTGAAFLELPASGRAAAMGDAYTALTDDAYATLWNPAGLAFMPGPQLAATYLIYLENTSNSFLSYAHPFKGGKQTLGASVQYFNPGSITERNALDQETGSFHGYSGAATLAYGLRLTPEWSLGASVKGLRSQIADVSASAYAAGGGVQFRPMKEMALGAAVDNIGTKIKFIEQEDALPMTGRLGGSYLFKKELTVALEGSYKKASGVAGHVGLEWPNNEGYAFRLGFNSERRRELFGMAGASAGFSVRLAGHDFAYTWLPFSELGNSHMISLLFRFGKQGQYDEFDDMRLQDKRNADSDFNLLKDFSD